jgi:hypothetical protein
VTVVPRLTVTAVGLNAVFAIVTVFGAAGAVAGGVVDGGFPDDAGPVVYPLLAPAPPHPTTATIAKASRRVFRLAIFSSAE